MSLRLWGVTHRRSYRWEHLLPFAGSLDSITITKLSTSSPEIT